MLYSIYYYLFVFVYCLFLRQNDTQSHPKRLQPRSHKPQGMCVSRFVSFGCNVLADGQKYTETDTAKRYDVTHAALWNGKTRPRFSLAQKHIINFTLFTATRVISYIKWSKLKRNTLFDVKIACRGLRVDSPCSMPRNRPLGLGLGLGGFSTQWRLLIVKNSLC